MRKVPFLPVLCTAIVSGCITTTVTQQAAKGRAIAGFQGGRSYTGMEIGHSFSGKEEIQVSAATRAVSQVEEFIQNNGSFPK